MLGVRHHLTGQPAPEVLYLCTTCGGTLKLGEDGRWRRRNRPSSAPAAGRRIPSHDVTSRHCMQEYQDWNPRKGAHSSEITSKQELRGSDSETKRREPKTRLKYTLSARIIQHAYRDYRHRQYLRDWAFSLVSCLRKIGCTRLTWHHSQSQAMILRFSYQFCHERYLCIVSLVATKTCLEEG